MRLPRDLGGEELAAILKKYGFQITRQTGSHIRLTSTLKGEHHITIPKHKPLKIGTLNSILRDVADYLHKYKQVLIEELFR
jgi:predicted RNA binding protein YcfA (HicA-like mRNA interferase family)